MAIFSGSNHICSPLGGTCQACRNSYLQITIITIRAVGHAVDVLRLFVSFWSRILPTREYVCKPASFPLARETAGDNVRECSDLYGVVCLGKCAWDCRVIAGLVPILGVEDCVFVLVCGSTPVLTDFRVNVLLDLFRSHRVPRAISAVFECVVFGCVLRFISVGPTWFRLALEVCKFNSIYRDRLHLAFHGDFHYFATPGDDFVWTIVRGGQRWCYCDSSQEYMWACFEFLILQNVFLCCIARWAQSEMRHGYP